MERVLRLKQIYDEKLPLMKIQRTAPKPQPPTPHPQPTPHPHTHTHTHTHQYW